MPENTRADARLQLTRFVRDNRPGMALVIAMGLLLLTFAINPQSMNINTFGSIIVQTMLLSFAAAGQTMVVISGGVDLSVGSVMSMAAVITTTIMQGRTGLFLPVLFAALAMGATIGLVNGLCVIKVGLPPIVLTLAVSYVVTRLQYLFTGGMPTGLVSELFKRTVQYRVFGIIPAATMYAVVIWALAFFLIHHSRFGKQLYLTGNNEQAARLNGVNTHRVRVLTYVLSGMFSAIAGVLGAGYMGMSQCQLFDNYAYNSLVAVVVGGTLFVGGVGSYMGSITGALVMIVLSNGLTVLDISSPIRNIVLGSVMVVILTFYNRSRPIRL
ncbi:MAG TPA: ABC transporter permease [Candidatus Limnocylindria bacterium]|nr:ABC transporter permease [Candidatus Limnocylindria bacterium]